MSTLQTMDVDQPLIRALTYDEKWERFKPLLAHLYLEEGLKLPKIRDFMRDNHEFRAE